MKLCHMSDLGSNYYCNDSYFKATESNNHFPYPLLDFSIDAVLTKSMSMSAEGKSKHCFWFVVFASHVNMNA